MSDQRFATIIIAVIVVASMVPLIIKALREHILCS